MITDEMIQNVFHAHGCYIDEDMSQMKAVRDLIALAQEVRPLVFTREHGCLWCKTSIGEYSIHPYRPDSGYVVELDECQEDDDVHETEEQAIAAAQDDFKRRTLANLVHGGGK